jgi:hypothetical protein
MNTQEHSKHLPWIAGLVGSITLAQLNTLFGVLCGMAGFILTCLYIYGWFEKRRQRHQQHQRDAGPGHGHGHEHGAGTPREPAGGTPALRGKEARRQRFDFWLMIFLLAAALLIWAVGEARGASASASVTLDPNVSTSTSTNGLQVTPFVMIGTATPTDAWARTVAGDAEKLVYDLLSGFSLTTTFHLLLVTYLGSKGLRNYTPLGRSAGMIGTLLRYGALEAGGGAAAGTREARVLPPETPPQA